MPQRYLNEVQSVFQGIFKDVLRNFQGCVEKVSSVFQENFNKKFQGRFKNVSMKFCFAILFSHGSHRSYPSRRRACFIQGQTDFEPII